MVMMVDMKCDMFLCPLKDYSVLRDHSFFSDGEGVIILNDNIFFHPMKGAETFFS